MYCRHCGEPMDKEQKYCSACGQENIEGTPEEKGIPTTKEVRREGFSLKINDPAFKKYVKNSNQYSAIFSIGLAVIALVGFTVAGEMGFDNMENPQAVYIGLTIGGMFILIALFQILGRKRSKTWDGTVVDKNIKRKRQRHDSDDHVWYEDYVEYKVFIRRENGKSYEITAKDDETLFNYYDIGDKIRHHGGLNSYEKFDKTGDEFIPCNACGTLCDIDDDVCFRCKCPLLK